MRRLTCRCRQHPLGTEKLLNCNLHVLISQTIDDRVEKGSKNCKHQCNGCVQNWWKRSREPQVHEGDTAIKHQEDTKMGSTCREGFLATFARGNPQNHSDDSDVRDGNHQDREDDGHSMNHILNQNHGGVRTGQTQHRFKVTEDLMNLVGTTEGQCGYPCNLWEQYKKTKDAGASRELSTEPGGHDSWVPERITDSNIPVYSHCGQQNTL